MEALPSPSSSPVPAPSHGRLFLRALCAVLAGVLAGVGVIMLVEMLGHLRHPPPPGLNPKDTAALARWVATLPAGAHAVVLAAWAAGMFTGAAVAARVGQARWPALVVAMFLLAGSIQMLITLPHPVWMWPGALILCPSAAFAGVRLAGAMRPDASPQAPQGNS